MSRVIDRRGFWLVFILVVAGILGWKLRIVPVKIDTGPSLRAISHQFLAAEILLTQNQGKYLSRQQRYSLTRLPDKPATLIVNRLPELNQAQIEAVDQWLTQGGQLILNIPEIKTNPTIASSQPEKAADIGLLSYYGIERYAMPKTVAEMRQGDAVFAAQNYQAGSGGYYKTLQWQGQAYDVHLHREQAFHITDRAPDNITPLFETYIDQGRSFYGMVAINVGAGRLIVVHDLFWISNDKLADFDHAHLLISWVSQPEFQFVTDVTSTHFWQIIWDKGRFAVLAGLVALLLWLWAYSGRRGPVLTHINHDRQDYQRYLKASAQMQFRIDNGQTLLQSTIHAMHQTQKVKPINDPIRFIQQTQKLQRS